MTALIIAASIIFAGDSTLDDNGFRHPYRSWMESGKTRCKIQLDGCLALSEGVEAEAQSLMIGGESAHADRTYGSGESSAMVKDDTHFAGKGTIFAHRIPGMVMIIK